MTKKIIVCLCVCLINMTVLADVRRPNASNTSARGTVSLFAHVAGTMPTNTQFTQTTAQMPSVVAENTQPAVIDNEAEYLQKKAFYEQLKQQADEIAENKLACEKAKKGWTAGTVIGGAGVIGTTIGAIVQATKIKDEKNEISEKQNTLKNLQ